MGLLKESNKLQSLKEHIDKEIEELEKWIKQDNEDPYSISEGHAQYKLDGLKELKKIYETD